MKIRPKITVDYDCYDIKARLTIAPNDDNPEWTIFHEKVLDHKSGNRMLFTVPNDSLDDLIQALTIYRNNLKEIK
jgi:hypothetical protein